MPHRPPLTDDLIARMPHATPAPPAKVYGAAPPARATVILALAPATPAPATPAPATPAPATASREDQTQCPRCRAYGCPAVGGTRRTAAGTVRYRACTACAHRFKTRARPGGRESVVG